MVTTGEVVFTRYVVREVGGEVKKTGWPVGVMKGHGMGHPSLHCIPVRIGKDQKVQLGIEKPS